MTAAQIMAILRYRLDDGLSGAFTDAELLSELNNAKDMIEMIGKFSYGTESATITEGSPTKTLTTVFNPISVVTSAGVILEKANIAKICVSNPTAISGTGTPKYWYMVDGTTLRLAPNPASATLLTIHGNIITARVTVTSQQMSMIPLCLQSTTLVDYAEANLRLARSAVKGNADVAAFLMKRGGELLGDYKTWL